LDDHNFDPTFQRQTQRAGRVNDPRLRAALLQALNFKAEHDRFYVIKSDRGRHAKI